MDSSNTFEFVSYTSNLKNKEISFHYRLNYKDSEYNFTEKLILPEIPSEEIPPELLDSLLHSIHIMLGISYWKLFCPENIIISTKQLSKQQATFWNTVYTKGLGEFFYKNKIDFRNLVQFPYTEEKTNNPTHFLRKNRSLVGIGGGKDSIVSAELLKKERNDFSSLLIETGRKHEISGKVTELIDKPVITLFRNVDPLLFDLNKEASSFNGHIPVSAVYAFLSILVGVLYDYKYVIVSNEKSANYGNVEFYGEVINHQWSKSYEFETMFQQYVSEHITQDVYYFSLLRPLSEMQITELFSKYSLYFPYFSSCNSNYSITKGAYLESIWCCECPKCAFVFTMLSAFLPKEQLIRIFGENLFNKESLVPVFKELLGISGFKPFECVGTPEEVTLAFYKAHEYSEFENDTMMKIFVSEVLPNIQNVATIEKEVYSLGKHNIPKEFLRIYETFRTEK